MSKLILIFNNFYKGLIKDVKSFKNDSLNDVIRKNYKALNKNSSEYLDFFVENFENVKLDSREEVLDRCILKEITVKQIVDAIPDQELFWNYYYIMATLSVLYRTKDDVLENTVINLILKKQKGEDSSSELESILDEEIVALVSHIKQTDKPANPIENMFSGMENSKIFSLAKEISEDIDVSNIKLDKPEDLMGMLNFGDSNNMMGNIIKKVSSKIQDKMASGELNQSDLFAETMGMMGKLNLGNSLFNNPMMSEVMKMAKKNKVHPRPDASSSRERLRKKLEKRKQEE